MSSASQIHLMREQAGEASSWGAALVPALASAWLWIPLTMFALASAAWAPFGRGPWLLPLAVHLGGALLVSAFRAAAVVVLNPLVNWYAEVPPVPRLYLTSLQNNVFLYLMLVGIGHAAYYAHTSRLREEQLATAQLQALKAQLQPHFFFNALNTISAFVRDRPDMAERMIDRLARLLRQTLDTGAAQEVTLATELAALSPYIEIEEARFGDRLTVTQDVDPETLDVLVPHLLLQPIVENAIRHGLSRRAAPGVVEIRARRDAAYLDVEVVDNGAGLPTDFDPAKTGGVGLANSRARLEQLYGRSQRFIIANRPDGPGTRVHLRIPFRVANSPREEVAVLAMGSIT